MTNIVASKKIPRDINKIVDETLYISPVHKKFIKTILGEWKEKILDKVLEINKNSKKLKRRFTKENNNVAFSKKVM